MKTFLHVLYTWLLANILHPFVWIIAERIMYGNSSGDFSTPIFLIFWVSFLFSIPAIFIAWAGSIAILNANYSGIEKLFLWYLAAISATAIDFKMVVYVFFGENLAINNFKIVLPALIATFLSISIRYKYFLQLNNIFNSNKLIHK